MSQRITYLINLYPAVSHTFIRREILALERQGFEIQRLALRGWDAVLVDEEDKREQERTRYLLQGGPFLLLWSLLRTFLLTPRRFIAAAALAMRMMGRASQQSWPYHVAYLAEACLMRQWVKAFAATHIHAHFVTNSTEVAMLVHVLGGPPFSFTTHNGTSKALFFHGVGEKVRRSAFVVAISSFTRGLVFLQSELADWSKIKVVHCGLDPASFSKESRPFPLAPRLVCIGRFCNEKGQILLVEAAYRLAQKGIDFVLVLGGDGERRSALEEQIARYGLGKQIHITGWISGDQVREEIRAARGLVLASFSEGLPVVIMEAMALRRPVLATYVGGIPELVRPGKDGWLFPAGSIDALTAAMEDCLTRPIDELRKMGEAAYLRVVERHSIDVEATKLGVLFRESCERPGSI